jgi:hypothetical protein
MKESSSSLHNKQAKLLNVHPMQLSVPSSRQRTPTRMDYEGKYKALLEEQQKWKEKEEEYQ